jgi:hypothetical protein
VLKRWRVAEAETDADGTVTVKAVRLVSDNSAFEDLTVTPADGEVRVVAELVEVIG